MKKIFFTLLTIAISIQGYSQTMNDNFESLSMDFSAMGNVSQSLDMSFNDLRNYSEWNAGEHYNMGQNNLGNNWNTIRNKFEEISYYFSSLGALFDNAHFHMQNTAENFAVFNGSYSSLSGLPTLFDGNFSSLSGTPTTLAGYGITDGFSGNYSDLSGKPTFRDLSSSSPVVFGSLDAFGGTFSNRATIDVIADSNGDLITGYKNGASGDRFNVKLDTEDESAIVSSGGGYELKLYSESGQITFEGDDLFNPVLFTFNGETEMNGNTVIEGTATADLFIGDGGGLTNLPTPSLAFSDLTTKPTTLAGYGITDAFDGNFSSLSGTPTTLAGYGITDAGDSPLSYNINEAGGIEVADYTTASGSRAFAVGNDNLASGSSSTAMGRGTIASGDDSTAIGANTEASGNTSTAIGYQTTASGDISTAMGVQTTASGTYSTATGYGSIASGTVSTAMGYGTTASGVYSTAIGYATTASGDYSTALGSVTTAEDYMSFALGINNKSGETPNPNEFSYQNTAFVIGNGGFDSNGAYDGHLSNAFEVLFDGTTTIAGDLNINSDARLKANIVSLGSTLSKLLKIDGKSYTMKKDENKKQKIGLLAQDIEKVFPELVSESHGVKSVNYQGLVPILINALKEQDEKMKSQQSQIDELRVLVQNLKK